MSAPARVLFLAHSHAFGPFRVGSHHFARALAADGADVVHLSTPMSVAHRATGRVDRRAMAALPNGPYRDVDGVTHIVPRTVLPAPYGRFRADRELVRHGIAASFDVVLIDQPLLWHDSLRGITGRLVYRPTDLYPEGVKHTLQSRVLAAVDGVVATSSEVLRGLGTLEIPTLVIENGVDAPRFTRSDETGVVRPPVCVYVGALDSRFDWRQVDAWARSYPGVRFVVAGPGGTPPAGLTANVEVLGPVPYDSLPALLHGASVGLLPLSDDRSNAGRSPMKLYEYLAAGLAVVTRETPVLRADEVAGVFAYASPDEAGAALRLALDRTSPNVAGAQRAAAESWVAKTAMLREFVSELTGR